MKIKLITRRGKEIVVREHRDYLRKRIGEDKFYPNYGYDEAVVKVVDEGLMKLWCYYYSDDYRTEFEIVGYEVNGTDEDKEVFEEFLVKAGFKKEEVTKKSKRSRRKRN